MKRDKVKTKLERLLDSIYYEGNIGRLGITMADAFILYDIYDDLKDGKTELKFISEPVNRVLKKYKIDTVEEGVGWKVLIDN